MAKIFIEEREYEVPDGINLLDACLSLGFDLPYFCWHPALHSVGACRQCAVKQFRDGDDARGRIVMACMTPAAEGTRISIADSEVYEFRARVIEWMMINHHHDCPVCDEGGECHLQDMTVMTGHAYRRYRGRKRTFRNQHLGPFINHEMNRCIQCYRCLRFYRDYAGGRDFGAFSLNHQVYFGRMEDGALESEFSGNLVEICPTGVFTDRSFKEHYTRKWDLTTAPSVCVHCGLGCNTIPGERYGLLRRIQNRFNGAVNGYFLCDRGRYGYGFVNSPERIRRPLVREGGRVRARSARTAAAHVSRLLDSASGVAGIGSPRASLEANFALLSLVGAGNFTPGLSDSELDIALAMIRFLKSGPARSPSLAEVLAADAVLVLGEDVSNTAPLLALCLRQSVRRQPLRQLVELRIPRWDDNAGRDALQEARGPLFMATPAATRLDDIAAVTYRAAPGDIARLGHAVALKLSGSTPGVREHGRQKREASAGVPELDEEQRELAARIASALKDAEQPLVVSGAGLGSMAVVEAAAGVAAALSTKERPALLSFVLPEANSMGAALMGGAHDSPNLSGIVEKIHSGAADTLIVLENDLIRRAAAADVDVLLGAPHLIALDFLPTAVTEAAEVVLPAAAFAEASGTLVSCEGRAQRFFKVFEPGDGVRESWRWLTGLGALGGLDMHDLDSLIRNLVAKLPVFDGIQKAAPPSGYRRAGQKIPRQPHRYSGRTAIHAGENVNEPPPLSDPDTPLSFSMEGFSGLPPAPLIPRYWSGGWNSVQALNKFQQEVGGPLRGGDPGLRLIEPPAVPPARPPGFEAAPPAFKRRPGKWLVIPVHHIFGSEELSVHSPGIRELSPSPYVGLAGGDAAALGLAEGDVARFEADGLSFDLPVKVLDELPSGTCGLPVCLPGSAGMTLPAGHYVTITPASGPARPPGSDDQAQ